MLFYAVVIHGDALVPPHQCAFGRDVTVSCMGAYAPGPSGPTPVNLSAQHTPVVDCIIETKTTLNNGYLGSRNDEERSEMRYLV